MITVKWSAAQNDEHVEVTFYAATPDDAGRTVEGLRSSLFYADQRLHDRALQDTVRER